jgi:NADPH2:quinone reductase
VGCDLVGRVINVGTRCDDIKVGDRVCAVGLAIGGNAKYAILPSSRVFCCPEDIHPTKVACLARNFMAAYQSLHRAGGSKIRPGQKVLIIGGAGALGQALIQLAIAAGADEVFATGKGSNAKRIIENLGAQALGRKPGEWLPYVKGEMDIVVDSVCVDDFVSSHRALKRGGKLVCVGSTAVAKKSFNWNAGLDPKKRFSVIEMASNMPSTSFYDVFSSLEMKRDIFRKDLFRLFHLVRNHEITPKVAFCVSLNEVANAHLDLEAGGIDGSIICLPFGPEGKQLSSRDSEHDHIKDYEDGVQVRESLLGGQIKSMFGKVMKDGTFKELGKDRDTFNDFDDDMYSRAGDNYGPQDEIRRVDTAPFGFQDDMDRSFRRGTLDKEDDDDDDEEVRTSSYNARSNRSGRQPVPRPSTRTHHRGAMDDQDEYIYGQTRASGRRDMHGDEYDMHSVRSSSRRGSSRNAGSRGNLMVDDDDDMRSARSSPRRGTSRTTGSRRNVVAESDVDMRSVRSRSNVRGGSSRNLGAGRGVAENDDDMRSVRSRSNVRGGSSRNLGAGRGYVARDDPVDDARRVRPASAMRSGSRRNVAPIDDNGDYGGNIRPSKSRSDDPDDFTLKRTPSILRNGNDSTARPAATSKARSSSKGSRQPVPRARSRSRDPGADQVLQRGRTRSRSIDSKRDERSPSLDSVYSQGTQKSAATINSEYSRDSAYSVDNRSLAPSVLSIESEYSPPEIREKEKSRRKKGTRARPEVMEKSPSKRGIFSRLRSKSKRREETKIAVTARPKLHRRSASKVPPPPPAREKDERKEMHAAHKSRRRKDDRPVESGKRSSSKRRESSRRRDETRDEYYEEEEVRSIVLLKGASEETMSEPEDMVLRTTDRSQDRIDGTRRSSSKPTSTLKRDSFRSSMRPSQGVTQRSSSRQTSSRNRSSSRGHNDDRY